MTNTKVDQIIASDLIDAIEQPKTISEKILIEKRRRHQTYMALDYFLSAVTYFDFFSSDAFKIVKNAKYLAQICEKSVTSELLLLPFFSYPSHVSSILGDFGITEEAIENIVASLQKKKKENFFQKQQNSVKQTLQNVKGFFVRETLALDQGVKYSHEVNKIFEKAAENALVRFKTPVISPEILFITLIEEKNSKAAKIIRKFLKDDVEWYLLRYKVIKRIHNQESNIRSEVIKNQHYFAYLMKIQLTDFEFNKLIENEALAKGVSLFRNTLISKILKIDIFEEISEEIYTSMKITNRRSYSK
jgi:ATP-dependent Clp protease ATP-binding subunit ClpA